MSNITKIINELSNIPEPLRDKERKRVIKLIHDSKHIFVSGSGRSGLMVDGFANRLLQLGLSVSVVGEITSPHTHSNDLIIFNSASGQSEKMIAQVKKQIVTELDPYYLLQIESHLWPETVKK